MPRSGDSGQHPLARVPSLPGQYSHEVHLQQRKLEVVEKPNGLSHWSSGDYSASLTAAAEGRQARFDQAAAALPPYAADSVAQMAADAAAASALAASRPSSGRSQHHQGDAELATGKVGGAGFGAEAYTDALQAAAAAKQQRYTAAATAGAPFAVAAGEGGMAGVPSGGSYHFQKPQHADPASKVGAGGYDQGECAEQCRLRAAAQDASRQRNRGTAGLLG